MGLFDFLKSKKTEQPNRLEDALREAFRDPENLPDFYRILLTETVYVVADTGKNLSIGRHIFKEGIPVTFEIYENGALALFSATERVYDNGVFQKGDHLTFLVYNGRKFMNDALGQKLVLNPYSNMCLILEPGEIKELLKHNLHIGNRYLERQNFTKHSNSPI